MRDFVAPARAVKTPDTLNTMKHTLLAAIILSGCTVHPVVRTDEHTVWLGASAMSSAKHTEVTVERCGTKVTYRNAETVANGTDALFGLLKLLWPF